MKLRNREVNIFSMSALDLFASGMGAFILLAFMALPFFPKTGTHEDLTEALAEVRRQRDEARSQRDQAESERDHAQAQRDQAESERDHAQAQRDQAESERDDAQAQRDQAEIERDRAQQEADEWAQLARKRFVLVLMSWSTSDDVDLHVVDPQGREFYYEKKTHSGSEAALEEDNTRGPGNEIWLHSSAEPGRYRVCYKWFPPAEPRERPPIRVRGSVFRQDGQVRVPEVRLATANQMKVAFDVVVDATGDVSVDESESGQVRSRTCQ